MQSISQIENLLKTFDNLNSILFKAKSNLEPLSLLNKISTELKSKLLDIEFVESINQLNSKINSFIELCEPITKLIDHEIAIQHNKTKKERIQEYADFSIDVEPVIKELPKKETPIKQSFKDLNNKAISQTGYPISEIKRKKPINYPYNCPYCNANNNYIYSNNNKGQYKCKVCSSTFSFKTYHSTDVKYFCPYCDYKLQLDHDRNNYLIYVCNNKKCSFYTNNKRKLSTDERKTLLTSSNQYKLHYTYREFKFTMDDVKKNNLNFDTKISLNKIHFSETVLGLAITYHINYGLSTRKTALIMKEIHNVKISHQTIANYCEMAASYTQNLLDKYNYKLSNEIAADETYIKIRGKTYYVFFFSDVKTKAILAYRIFEKRDTLNALKSTYMAISKYDEIPENFIIVTDGNPIYNAAQLFLSMNGIEYTLHQVIGVKNKNEESKIWRPHKQTEERLNRTFKQNYYGMNGYDNIKTANIYMVLFSTFFNFLRQHSSLNYKPPVELDIFEDNDLMPIKWVKLINYSITYAK